MSLFNFFGKKTKSFVGVDIGASAVKIVQLKKEDGRYKLENYAIYLLKEQLKRGNYQIGFDSSRIPAAEMAEIIKKAMAKAEIKTKEVYLSVPVYSSFSTLIDLPEMSKKEIASAIPFEARKYVPVPITEVVLDWSLISVPNKASGYQVLVIAVPKKVINYYNEIMKLAGLAVKGIEEETFSLSRVLVGNDRSAVLLMDAGARSINVSIIDDGYIRVSHNLELGGLKVTKAIAEQMNFDIAKAEEVKRGRADKVSESHALQVESISRSIMKLITLEVKKIIDNYQNKYRRRVEKCVLAGSGIHLAGFVDYLTENLSLDVSLGSPFARIEYPGLLKPVLRELGPSLAVAVGLAMRED